MEILNCRSCGKELSKHTAIYLTGTNWKTEKPACQECYEKEVRSIEPRGRIHYTYHPDKGLAVPLRRNKKSSDNYGY